MLKSLQWLPSALWMRAQLPLAEQKVFLCPPPQPRLCPLPPQRPLLLPAPPHRLSPGLCTCNLSWEPARPRPHPQPCALSLLPTLLLTPPRHFSFCSCLPMRAQHTSSSPEARANACSVTASRVNEPQTATALGSSTEVRCFEFVPRCVSIRARAQNVIPAAHVLSSGERP